MFVQLLGEHFVHTALLAGGVVAVVSGVIGVFVVTRGMSFAVHAVSELGFTGAAGALVLGFDPVLGMLGGSLLVGLVLGFLSLRGRERDSAIGSVLAFGLGAWASSSCRSTRATPPKRPASSSAASSASRTRSCATS
jgi:zinc/manganese transport system permease protein